MILYVNVLNNDDDEGINSVDVVDEDEDDVVDDDENDVVGWR